MEKLIKTFFQVNKITSIPNLKTWIKSFMILYLFLAILFFSGCNVSDNNHINFIGRANHGVWSNDIPEQLTFGSANEDSKGFARYPQTQLEDGLHYDLLLETHPRWAQNGSVEGHFRITIPDDCSFRGVVGFVEGATKTDGVTFQVFWKKDNQPAGNPPITALQGEYFKTYDHTLGSFIVDLRPIAGQTGEFIIKVKAGQSSGQDWAVWQTALIAPFAENADIDKDGISDDFEWQVLQKFSPYFKFSKERINFNTVQEEYRPTDAIWYVRHCDLLYGDDENSPVVFKRNILNTDAGMVTNSQWHGGDQSNILWTSAKTSFRLNIYNEFRSGFNNGDGHDWPEILNKKNIGLYGHVVPMTDKNQLVIEYWQFFGFNQANAYNVDAYDHEADWCVVKMTYNISGDSLTAITYAHHGDLTTRLLGRGKNHFFEFIEDNKIEVFKEDDFDVVNNFVEFYRDPISLLYNHPVVYIEWGGHEFWPRPAGSHEWSPNHDGTGDYFYLTENVPNLGEVENPMFPAFGVIMQFNGRWGAWNSNNENPPGIELHTEWLWPQGSLTAKTIPHEDFED